MKINKIKMKKAQHEIVGFILIVVIVVVIGLFMLIFYIRKTPVEYENTQAANFLQASMLYTTDCAVNFEPQYHNLEDLIKSCYKNERCLSEEMACSALNGTLAELAHESWLVSPDKPVNSYSLLVYYEESGEDAVRDEILSLEEGNCTGSKTGAEYLLHHSPGNIIIAMEICYS